MIRFVFFAVTAIHSKDFDVYLNSYILYYKSNTQTQSAPDMTQLPHTRISYAATMPGLIVHGSDHISSSNTCMEHEKKWVSGFSFDRESMMIAHTGWLWNQ